MLILLNALMGTHVFVGMFFNTAVSLVLGTNPCAIGKTSSYYTRMSSVFVMEPIR